MVHPSGLLQEPSLIPIPGSSKALPERAGEGGIYGTPPPPCSHIVETVIVHVSEHSNDIPCPEGQLRLWRAQEAGVSPGEALPAPYWLSSICGSSPPRPCWGSSPGGCSQMQPPWYGEISGWQRKCAGCGLQGKGERGPGALSGPPMPYCPPHWRPADPLFTTPPLVAAPGGNPGGHPGPTLSQYPQHKNGPLPAQGWAGLSTSAVERRCK